MEKPALEGEVTVCYCVFKWPELIVWAGCYWLDENYRPIEQSIREWSSTCEVMTSANVGGAGELHLLVSSSAIVCIMR